LRLETCHVSAQRTGCHTKGAEDLPRWASDLLRQGVQKVFDLDALGAIAIGLALCSFEEVEHRRREVRRLCGGGEALQGAFDLCAQLHDSIDGSPKDLGHTCVPLQAPGQEVQWLDLGVFALVGECLGSGDQSATVVRVAFQRHRACFVGSHADKVAFVWPSANAK
jgi:hypothetical protein